MTAVPCERLANRGRLAEKIVELTNALYRRDGLAVVHKVPTAWLPIRDRTGRLVSAKVEAKAVVDFLGHAGGVPIAFDVKSVERGERWPLSRLEEHQADFLRDWSAGGISFLLVAFWETGQWFAPPFSFMGERWEAWQKGAGPASLRIGDLKEWQCDTGGEYPVDYLPVVKIEAEQKVAQARAEAEALRIQREQVTPELLRLREIEVQRAAVEKWDGKMPQVTGNALPFIQVPATEK